MIIAAYFVNFIVFSFMGWVWETVYCTFKTKHWQNRGFLYGPVCPIYGTAAVTALIVFNFVPVLNTGSLASWKIFLICAAGSAVIEYTTSYVLEKIFHAVWWDYSKVPLNVNGRICLPATCGFGLAGIMIVRYLFPFIRSLHQENRPLLNEGLSLFFMFLFAMDLALTIASLTELITKMENYSREFNARMEAGVEIAQQGPAATLQAAKAAVSSAAETAVIGAYVTASDLKDYAAGKAGEMKEYASGKAGEMSERMRRYAAGMSPRQKYHLNSIQEFCNADGKAGAEKLKEALTALQEKLGTAADRAERRK
ncbi:MAG TPA: hypothetical protein DCQ39_06910 [Lachnospiraceae bacterium]|nr:hypothetical protein [Lachnospiraceae bacterium]HAP73494.1 hypothetical protein [Lachnospiraceae bacterium]